MSEVSGMEHATVRSAVLDDEADRPEVQRHLARCEECSHFADEVARIVSVAPTLYPHGASEGLADRVVAAVQAAPAVATDPRARRRGLWADVRQPLLRSTAVAAVLLLILGVLAVARYDDDPSSEQRVLLAAATATEEAGTAEVRVDGSVSVAVPRPADASAGTAGAAQFRGLPPELEAHFEREWSRIMAEFERQLAEWERQVEQVFEQFDRQMEEFERQFGSGGGRPGGARPPTAPRPPAPPAPPAAPDRERGRPTLPDVLDASFSIRGHGALAFAGDLGIEGTVEPSGGNIVTARGASTSAGFRLVARGDEVVVRQPDGSWRRLPGAAGPLGAVVLRPGAVPRILRAATGDIERLGDGRFRFEVDASDVVTVKGSALRERYQAEVWIGPDNRVQRLAVSSRGTIQDQTWQTLLTLELGAYGSAQVNADAPPPATRGADSSETAIETDASLVVYPFGPTIAATLRP